MDDSALEIPEPCRQLRERLINLLVAGDALYGSECELAHLPESAQQRKLREMGDERLALQTAIAEARRAVPGVANFIDPLLSERRGQWTTVLNQHLANLAALLLSHGRRAAGEGQAWAVPMKAIADAKNLLINADYSAVGQGEQSRVNHGTTTNTFNERTDSRDTKSVAAKMTLTLVATVAVIAVVLIVLWFTGTLIVFLAVSVVALLVVAILLSFVALWNGWISGSSFENILTMAISKVPILGERTAREK